MVRIDLIMVPKLLVSGMDLIISVLVLFCRFGVVEHVNRLRKDWPEITMAATSFYGIAAILF